MYASWAYVICIIIIIINPVHFQITDGAAHNLFHKRNRQQTLQETAN